MNEKEWAIVGRVSVCLLVLGIYIWIAMDLINTVDYVLAWTISLIITAIACCVLFWVFIGICMFASFLWEFIKNGKFSN